MCCRHDVAEMRNFKTRKRGRHALPRLHVLKLRYLVVAKRRQHIALGVSPRSLMANAPSAAKRRQQFARHQFAAAASRLTIPCLCFPWAYALVIPHIFNKPLISVGLVPAGSQLSSYRLIHGTSRPPSGLSRSVARLRWRKITPSVRDKPDGGQNMILTRNL